MGMGFALLVCVCVLGQMMQQVCRAQRVSDVFIKRNMTNSPLDTGGLLK